MTRLNTLLILISSCAMSNVNCLQNCLSEPIFLLNENSSATKSNFTLQFDNKVIVDAIWSQNDTGLSSDGVVPSISNYERGKVEKSLKFQKNIKCFSHFFRHNLNKHVVNFTT